MANPVGQPPVAPAAAPVAAPVVNNPAPVVAPVAAPVAAPVVLTAEQKLLEGQAGRVSTFFMWLATFVGCYKESYANAVAVREFMHHVTVLAKATVAAQPDSQARAVHDIAQVTIGSSGAAHALLAAADSSEEALKGFYTAFQARASQIQGGNHGELLGAALRLVKQEDARLSSPVMTILEGQCYTTMIRERVAQMLQGDVTVESLRTAIESLKADMPNRLFGSDAQKETSIVTEMFRLLSTDGDMQARIGNTLRDIAEGNGLDAARAVLSDRINGDMLPLLAQLTSLLGPQGRLTLAQTAFETATAELEAVLTTNVNGLAAAADVTQPLAARVAVFIGNGQGLADMTVKLTAYVAAKTALDAVQAEFNALCRNDANGNVVEPRPNNLLGTLGDHQPNTDAAIAGTLITGGSIGRLIEQLGRVEDIVNTQRRDQQRLLEQLHVQPGTVVAGETVQAFIRNVVREQVVAPAPAAPAAVQAQGVIGRLLGLNPAAAAPAAGGGLFAWLPTMPRFGFGGGNAAPAAPAPVVQVVAPAAPAPVAQVVAPAAPAAPAPAVAVPVAPIVAPVAPVVAPAAPQNAANAAPRSRLSRFTFGYLGN